MNRLRAALRHVGLDVIRWPPFDFDEFDRAVIAKIRPYTMTSPERIVSLIDAVEYVVRAGISGSIVECGVWRGGTIMAAALTLSRLNELRDLYLYDTFEGMTSPGEFDLDFMGNSASSQLATRQRGETSDNLWAYASLESVKAALQQTPYPADRTHFVVGPVEETIPGIMPAQIALLRLDTDWFESTKHELVHLFPSLSIGGILIIDDYGFHLGARRAVDEFFKGKRIFLSRVDNTGRIAIKTHAS